MIELEIPGFGPVRLNHLVSDYNGTLAVDGALIPGVREKLHILASILDVHVVTADTFGIARRELADILVHSALDGLDLLLNPGRLKATLRI